MEGNTQNNMVPPVQPAQQQSPQQTQAQQPLQQPQPIQSQQPLSQQSQQPQFTNVPPTPPPPTYNPNLSGASQNDQAQIEPGGWFRRCCASLIDGLILSIPIALIMLLIYFILNFVFKVEPNLILIILGLTLIVLELTYSVYLTVNKGATWGKDAYGLKVVKYKTTENITYGKSILRELLKSGFYFIPMISGLFAFVNGLTIVFSHERRGIHDKLAGTQVIKFKRPWSMKKQLLILAPLLLIFFLLLFFITWMAINPAGQSARANNTERMSDIHGIWNATNQYIAENNGDIPEAITTSEQEISKTQADLCSVLVPEYMAALPADPKVNNGNAIIDCNSSYSTGYTIFKDASTNKITVKALHSEMNEKIEITR